MELWKVLLKDLYEKERRAVDQNKFDKMELELMKRDGKILVLEARLADYREEALKNGLKCSKAIKT